MISAATLYFIILIQFEMTNTEQLVEQNNLFLNSTEGESSSSHKLD